MYLKNIVDACGVTNMGEFFTGVKYNFFTPEKAVNSIKSMKTFAVKLIADQLNFDNSYIEEVLKVSDSIIYLYRKNFISQVLSYIAATETSSYAAGFDQPSDTIEIRVPKVNIQAIYEYEEIIRNNYLKMSYFHKIYPGKIVCLEDIKQNPYNKKITWFQPINEITKHISDLDVAGLFE